jgi:hypothetical protein
MRRHAWLGALFGALVTSSTGVGAEPACCPPPQECFLERLAPVGGWHPYGTSMLHWWPCHCFPCGGAPDDYCRKPLPRVCWPPYPAYYIDAPPEVCCPPKGCCDKLH